MRRRRSAFSLLRCAAGRRNWRARLPLVVASLLCSLAWASDPPPQPRKSNVRKLGLVIHVQGGGWGKASLEDIETVLEAAAGELVEHLPSPLQAPIVVTHTDGPPVALYGRGGQGEYRIHLHARGENWHLYAYEFAHELCHLLSNHEGHPQLAGAVHPNQWFEEAVCEAASLYVLKNLAATWSRSPPEARWLDEAPLFQRFFDALIAEGHRRLPAGTPLSEWLQRNELALRSDPYLRQKNEVLANLLLPLFEADPTGWQALAYLNQNPEVTRASLRAYLGDWYRSAPLPQRSLVAGVLALLHLEEVLPRDQGAVDGVLSRR